MELTIKSRLNPYKVIIEKGSVVDGRAETLTSINPDDFILLIDENVFNLYPNLKMVPSFGKNIIRIPATEEEKSINGVIRLYSGFLNKGITRRHKVVAVGGGIIQDLAGFTSHTFMRGLKWWFCPTTLLAQADSCIGSKTSINFENKKNILGSFYPPELIIIDLLFLNTLKRQDIISGAGEIIKVHCMDNERSLLKLGEDIDELINLNPEHLSLYIRQSLDIKRRFIEEDEFDTGYRLLLNYGHCLGHAIEAASDFAIPHGIGVIFGVEYANLLSKKRGILPESQYLIMHNILEKALKGFRAKWVEPEKTLYFLRHDKKRTGKGLTMILSSGIGRQEKVSDISEDEFFSTIDDFKNEMKDFFIF